MEGQDSSYLSPRFGDRPGVCGICGKIAKLGEQTGEDTATWTGYLNALRKTRLRFKALGCTATDHGHLTAQTADLTEREARALFSKVLEGKADAPQQVLFRRRC